MVRILEMDQIGIESVAIQSPHHIDQKRLGSPRFQIPYDMSDTDTFGHARPRATGWIGAQARPPE
jgi:hypothetical protein